MLTFPPTDPIVPPMSPAQLSKLTEPTDYFKGMGHTLFTIPTNILLYLRTSKDKLQQAALQNRSHHRHVLIFNLETEGHVHVNNRVLPLKPQQSLLILPYQFHHFSQLENPQLKWLFCTFELATSSSLEPLRNSLVDTSEHTRKTRDELLSEWLRATTSTHDLPKEQLQATLIRVLISLKQDHWTAATHLSPEPRNNLLRNINRCMSEWKGRPVVVGDLAREFNLSESRLRARFKQAAGIPLGSYLQNYRLNCAMALLRTTKLPIAEIAEEAGFGSPQAFSRLFKKETGCTPRAYRQQR